MERLKSISKAIVASVVAFLITYYLQVSDIFEWDWVSVGKGLVNAAVAGFFVWLVPNAKTA